MLDHNQLQIAPVVVLLSIKDGVSRIHASRRVFEAIQSNAITTPVIHHITFPSTASRCEEDRNGWGRA